VSLVPFRVDLVQWYCLLNYSYSPLAASMKATLLRSSFLSTLFVFFFFLLPLGTFSPSMILGC
jgi:hypothetical protein